MNKLIPIEHNLQRVLTTQQIADGYDTDPQVIRNNFNRNKEHYSEGIHYYLLDGAEFQAFRATNQIELPPNISSMYIWTEKGALLHAKSLNTGRAWEVYSELVETYFRTKELKPQCVEDLIIIQAQSMKELRAEVKQLQSTQQVIKEAVISEPDNWRDDINHKVNKIARAVGTDKFRDIRTESYKLLEVRAHVDLKRRLDNYRVRLLDQGHTKTDMNNANYMDVIEQDPKLREIYGKIVSEYVIKFVA